MSGPTVFAGHGQGISNQPIPAPSSHCLESLRKTDRAFRLTKQMTFTRFALNNSTPSLWRVTFSNPPINLIDYTMIRELSELFADIEEQQEPAV